MTSIVYVLVVLAIVLALCISIVSFWRDSTIGVTAVRRLAAASAGTTLLVFVLIYAGGFTHHALVSLRSLNVSSDTYHSMSDALTSFNRFVTDIVAGIDETNAELTIRTHPPLWPLVLICLGYGIRFLIYRFHTKKQNVEAALTGSVYWSHITLFVMAMAFLVAIAHWSPWLVVPLSLTLAAAFIVSVKLWLEDAGIVLRAGATTIWTVVRGIAHWVAYAATEVAGWVRAAVTYANDAYVEHIRMPLRARTGALEGWSRKRNEAWEERLRGQDARHGERFDRREGAGTDDQERPTDPTAEPTPATE